VHGEQEGKFFHGYYDSHGYMSVYVFCGRHLLAAQLRPANIDAENAHVPTPGEDGRCSGSSLVSSRRTP
jgi:hypothetical protein